MSIWPNPAQASATKCSRSPSRSGPIHSACPVWRSAIAAVAPALAIGGEITADGIVFPALATPKQRTDAISNYLKAAASEVSMMARCTGKTDVRNIEPEDLRAITLASSKAFGIPLAGQKRGTVIEAAE